MSKYSALEEYFKKQVEIELTLAEIEKILGSKLPESAFKDRTWWGNTSHPTRTQAHSWINAGWKVKSVVLGKSVTFVRDSSE
ncbi:hypothetical protein [Paenibacillus sp. FSL H8-0259]|uniref:DUF7662 domain-containing protein n=1 Tax=Paenibacillus sp. FSL H8-0259 TaxID=1920423 RepID=UPI00096DFE1F|nr:hypothetical protein [Paenibacillus sp. FSL H8-0259]OMF30946.1 hypothetical protein BK132_05820 [Paenibacillus sp. FSL H8-0259]